jgi:hypothetical protein
LDPIYRVVLLAPVEIRIIGLWAFGHDLMAFFGPLVT